MEYLTSPKLYKKDIKVMIKSVIIENKEVKYDDKEFEFCVDNQTQKVFLCYRGNGVGIKNPKENLSCNYMFRSKNVNVEIIKNGVDYSNITSLDLSKFNTEFITTMISMFEGYPYEKLDVSYLNTKNVKNMYCMFDNCKFLQEINLSNLVTNNVEIMYGMFDGCESLKNLDLSHFDTRKVKSMYSMFNSCKSLKELDLSKFDTRNVETLSYMFENCKSLQKIDISNFNTNKVTYMDGMFLGCSSLQYLDILNFNTRSVKNMQSMFEGCSSLKELDLTSFTFTQKPKVEKMFNRCSCIVYVKNIWSKNYLIKNTGYTNIHVKEQKLNNKMIYEVYKSGVQKSKRVICKNPKEAICKVFGITEDKYEIQKIDSFNFQQANVCVKGVGNKRNTTNFYLVK